MNESSASMKGRIGSMAVTAIAFVLVASGLVGLIRDYGKESFLSIEPPHLAPPSSRLAKEWMDSVKAASMKRSLLCAAQIAPEESFEMPCLEYLSLFSDNGVRMGFLTDGWNFSDFSRWQDLFEAQRLAKEICKSQDSAAKDIFEAVDARLKPPENPDGKRTPPVSALEPWRDGRGNSSDKIRLICALASQAGFDTVVAGLFKTPGMTIRDLCELRRGAKAWTIDAASGAIWEGTTRDLASKPDMVPKDWGPDEKAALKGPIVYLIPAEPQDYRRLERLLYGRLATLRMEELPALPEDPMRKLKRLSLGKGPDSDLFSYWQVPLLSLRSIPGNPAGWIK